MKAPISWVLLNVVSLTCLQFNCDQAGSTRAAEVPSADRPLFASGTISGRVLDDTGKSVSEATITLLRYDAPSHRFGHLVPAGSPITTDHSATYRFENLIDGYYILEVQSEGYARALVARSIENGLANSTADVVVQRPADIIIELQEESGKPIEGAEVRSFNISGKNGPVRVTQMFLRDLKLGLPASDSNGQITLHGFPQGEIVNLTISHPTFAPVKIKDLKVAKGIVGSATMKPGIVLTFRRQADNSEEEIKSAVIDLRHSNFDSPSTMLQHEIDFDSTGKGTVTIEPGDYQFLRLQHDDFYLTPTLTAESGTLESTHPLHFDKGKNVELTFQVHRRLSATGRVIDAETGEPVTDESLLGEILTGSSTSERDRTQFNFTGWGETNARGEFTLPVVAGRMRVEFHGTNRISETEYTDFEVASDGSTVIPDIKVRSLPKFSGVVRNPDGTPAKHAVVRFRGQVLGSKSTADPVLTDDDGRFELQPKFLLKNHKTDQRQLEFSIVAFDPFRPLAGRIDIRLDRPEAVELTLQPHDFDWPLTEFEEEFSDWERGSITAEQAAENAAISLRGQPVPELDCVDWINSEELQLSKLRGKYVLLDFWFIGCGPCHAEFPVVKMLHELYHDKGLVVIGVHNNNDPPETVRKHVKEIGLPFPVAVDHPDGRTVAEFQSHKLVGGFPSYVLIDPEGNVLLDDRTIPHPTLRGYKVEILRKLLFRKPPEVTVP